MFFKKSFFLVLVALLSLTLILAPGCAKKKSGDDDDDDDESDDDTEDDVESGVGSYSVHLNMVPVTLGSHAGAASQTLFDESAKSFSGSAILASDLINALDPFSEDADGFSYEFITADEGKKTGEISYADLSKLAFYEDADTQSLCLGWTENGHAADSFCGMKEGLIITHPKQGAFEIKSLAWMNERSGDQPAHLGQTIAVKAVVSVGADTIVSGDYLKTYLLQDGYGLKIFAEAGATQENQGYEGSLTTGIDTFIGDEVFVLGRITVHDDMIEFVPKSGYHVAVLSTNNPIEDPKLLTTDELIENNMRYAAALVRINDVKIVDVDADDPATDWPEYGTKSKDIFIRQMSGGAKVNCLVYENTGLPGSDKPADGFDIIGVTEIDGDSANIFPRRVEDLNPAEESLEGQVRVTVVGEDLSALVDLSELKTGLQPLGADDALIPVVSFAEVAHAAGLTRNPKLLDFKPVAYDDRQPFETVIFNDLKSGVLYQGVPDDQEQPNPMVNSHFWPQMGLSDIFYLRGIDRIHAYRAVEPPTEGEAEYGEGITLLINGKSYAVKFSSMPQTEYNGKAAVRADQAISDLILNLYTMNGSFSADEIKALYDYRFAGKDDSDEATVAFEDLEGGYLILDADPYIIFPELGDNWRVDYFHVVDMMRYIQVDFGDGEIAEKIYLRNCATSPEDVGEGVIEDVVFYDTVLRATGSDPSENMYLYDLWVVAIDGFISKWDYGHGHFDSLYIRPYENRGFTADPGVGAYGGRASSKAVYEIRLIDVPQEAPSIPVEIEGQTVWSSDANTCEGCHVKSEELHIPINCAACHTIP
jgi:hypothetical protein